MNLFEHVLCITFWLLLLGGAPVCSVDCAYSRSSVSNHLIELHRRGAVKVGKGACVW